MRLLLHTCCANCSIYPVQRFRSRGIDLTGLWFNPNIHPFGEYSLRLSSMKRLSQEWNLPVIYNDIYEPGPFLRGLIGNCSNIQELLSEEGSLSILKMAPYRKRCEYCYRVRLEETVRTAKDNGFDAFSTTLLVSPYQDLELIARTGKELAERYNIEFLFEDMRPGYKEALDLSKKMGLYRQKYCGCIFSRLERDKIKKQPLTTPS